VQLIAGDRASITSKQPIRTERLANPERSIDWRARRLVFDQTPLAEVIAEFNRYSETPLRLESATLAGKRINGVFDASDRASLVRFLEEFEGVLVEPRDSEVLLKAGQD
jgi:transmembrane sensor